MCLLPGSIGTTVVALRLCFYIALESVAVAIAGGSDLIKARITRPNKTEKYALRVECIQLKHSELFSVDPIKFVTESYFECVESLTTKVRAATSLIFGADHHCLKLLFEKSSGDDMALSKLRSELAHGDVTLLHKKHEHLVRRHLHEMGQITRDFLLRVLLRLDPTEQVPTWSQKFQM